MHSLALPLLLTAALAAASNSLHARSEPFYEPSMYTRDELLEELYAREALLDEDYLYARSDLYQDLDLYTREEALFLAREANLAAIENKVKTSMHNTKESVKGATKNTHAAAKIRELEANSCNFRKCALAMAPTIGGCAAAAAAMGANPVADVSCTGALVTAGMKLPEDCHGCTGHKAAAKGVKARGVLFEEELDAGVW